MKEGTRRAAGMALAGLVAVLLSGCAGGGGPSNSAYVSKANTSCAAAKAGAAAVDREAARAVGEHDPFDPAAAPELRVKAAPFLAQLAHVYRKLHDDLAALKTPKDTRASVDKAVGHLGRIADGMAKASAGLATGASVDRIEVSTDLAGASAALRATGADTCVLGG